MQLSLMLSGKPCRIPCLAAASPVLLRLPGPAGHDRSPRAAGNPAAPATSPMYRNTVTLQDLSQKVKHEELKRRLYLFPELGVLLVLGLGSHLQLHHLLPAGLCSTGRLASLLTDTSIAVQLGTVVQEHQILWQAEVLCSCRETDAMSDIC